MRDRYAPSHREREFIRVANGFVVEASEFREVVRVVPAKDVSPLVEALERLARNDHSYNEPAGQIARLALEQFHGGKR